MNKSALLLAAFCCFALVLQAQSDTTAPKKPSLPPAAIVVDVGYSAALPLADFAKTYSHALNLGVRVNYLSPRNWLFAVQGDYFFAEKIRIDAVSNLREENGFIIDRQGALADVKQGLRGFYLHAGIGKIVPFDKRRNPRFGLEFRFHAGYFQHWIRLKFGGEDLVQLSGDYRQGYDRKSSGFGVQQYLGLRYMSSNGLLNLSFGIEALEGFTRNRRYWNYDEMRADNALKIDILTAARITLSIPFYLTPADEDIDKVKIY